MKGLNELTASFDADKLTAVKESRKAVEVATKGGERDAKIFAPVDTGNLRNGVTSEVRYSATSTIGTFGPSANYAPFVEDGTARMAPQAFVGPAFDRNTPPFISAMEAITGKLG